MKNYILSYYPVPEQVVVGLGQHTDGELEKIVVSNLVADGIWEIFKNFNRLKGRAVYLIDHGEEGQPLLPYLKVLATLIKADQHYLVSKDVNIKPFGMLSAVLLILPGIFKMAGSYLYLILFLFLLKSLLHKRPIRPLRKSGQNALYLKISLWMGVKAGGAIAHTKGVMAGLLSAGYNLDVVEPFAARLFPEKEKLTSFTVPPRNLLVLPREFNSYLYNHTVIKECKKRDFDGYRFIYQRFSQGGFAGVVLSRFFNIPLIIEYNGSEVWLAENWGHGLKLKKLAVLSEAVTLRHAYLVVAVSDPLKDDLIARGVAPERIVVHPNGVNPKEFDPGLSTGALGLRNELGIDADAKVTLFIGTFGPWHGAEILAQGLRILWETDQEWMRHQKLHVVFVGDGVRRTATEEILSGKVDQDRYSFTGLVPQDEAFRYLSIADIFVAPNVPNVDGSPFFGSPTKLFEYMAMARPVITSNLVQLGEIFSDSPLISDKIPDPSKLPTKAAGLRVLPNNPEDIASAIKFLCEHRNWSVQAGANARQLVLEKYTWEQHTRSIIDGLERNIDRELNERANKPVRILLNALHAKTGGGVTYLNNILPLISQNINFEFHLCIHEEQTNILPELDERVHLHTFNFKQGFWRLPIWEQIEVPRLARKIGADVTFSPANYGPLFAPNPVIMLRNALSVAFVERRAGKMAYWLLVSIGTFLSMAMCNRAITVSKYARDSNFGSISGFLRSRINIIPHGVSKVFSSPKNVSARQDYILAVSDIYVQKNLKNLLYAIALLKLKKPNIKLKIAGRFVDEKYHSELDRIISEKSLHENVQFLGGVNESVLVDLYRHCAVFAFPSTVETFGNPLVEAMASGAPIASSNTAAMPEVAGDAALYFNPHDVEDMASTIARLLDDKDLCEELTQKALARAENYSWEKTAESTLDILYQAANEASP